MELLPLKTKHLFSPSTHLYRPPLGKCWLCISFHLYCVLYPSVLLTCLHSWRANAVCNVHIRGCPSLTHVLTQACLRWHRVRWSWGNSVIILSRSLPTPSNLGIGGQKSPESIRITWNAENGRKTADIGDQTSENRSNSDRAIVDLGTSRHSLQAFEALLCVQHRNQERVAAFLHLIPRLINVCEPYNWNKTRQDTVMLHTWHWNAHWDKMKQISLKGASNYGILTKIAGAAAFKCCTWMTWDALNRLRTAHQYGIWRLYNIAALRLWSGAKRQINQSLSQFRVFHTSYLGLNPHWFCSNYLF